MMVWLGAAGVLAPVVMFGYAYIGYPLLLRLLAGRSPPPLPARDPASWPRISITLPCHNEEQRLRTAIEGVLRSDYPADRREIIVVSDASTDATDEIARDFADCGVQLIRLPERRGKTAAENAGVAAASGEIVVNVDASVGIRQDGLKALVRSFEDPTVGVASSCDVSVGELDAEGNHGESGYVGYEMRIRALETRLGSIVGASGSFFAMRRDIHEPGFPEELSRDFASALLAVERGFRAVSVEDAICLVPRTRSLRTEFRRKARTMTRGLETLWYKRHLMNPLRHGVFAWMLISHKLCRWLVYLTLPLAVLGTLVIGAAWPAAWLLVGPGAVGMVLGIIGMRWPDGRRAPAVIALPGFALASIVAGILAWLRFFRGQSSPVWEPTRR
ncbi:MAG TPA: glycosyltransferase [Gemmatimonadaceae bacterium]|nr:glycosyltransferase [Gemmatimonadaceae bacterium]